MPSAVAAACVSQTCPCRAQLTAAWGHCRACAWRNPAHADTSLWIRELSSEAAATTARRSISPSRTAVGRVARPYSVLVAWITVDGHSGPPGSPRPCGQGQGGPALSRFFLDRRSAFSARRRRVREAAATVQCCLQAKTSRARRWRSCRGADAEGRHSARRAPALAAPPRSTAILSMRTWPPGAP